MMMMKFNWIITLLSTALLASQVVADNNNNNASSNNHERILSDGTQLASPLLAAGAGGNAHIIPWKNAKHYQHLGQCDLVLMKDEFFADGLGLAVHIRTKVDRYWSFVKSVAVRIGNDILEIEGSSNEGGNSQHANYWINFDYQGDLDHFAGFPVTQQVHSDNERSYKIYLSSQDNGQDITVIVYKQFVRVQFHGTEAFFGHTAGLLGNYQTGKTFGRNGITELNDRDDLAAQWQVLPYEPRLFRESSFPQYPKKCRKPQDPRESDPNSMNMRGLSNDDNTRITYQQAQMACFNVMSDPASIKDCVIDVLATQDLDMVGAYV